MSGLRLKAMISVLREVQAFFATDIEIPRIIRRGVVCCRLNFDQESGWAAGDASVHGGF